MDQTFAICQSTLTGYSPLLFVLACAKNQTFPTTAFFGGQIIQPSSDYVSLYKFDQRFDTLPLDGQSRFAKKYDSLPFGLFKMEHLPEHQMVIIEPGDSIWARANMADFNASLVFSGRGSAKNNFLVNTFLELQNEVGFLASKYATSSKIFWAYTRFLIESKKGGMDSF